MLRLLLALTLTSNLVIGALWWRQRDPSPRPTTAPPEAHAQAEPIRPSLRHDIPDTELAAYLTDPTPSDADAVARLRAAGVPADVIRLLIRPRVHARFISRWQALVERSAALPYWTPYRGLPDDLRREVSLLGREEHAALVDLLGDDAYAPEEGRHYHEAKLDFLPPAQRSVMRQLHDDYGDLRASLLAQNGGIFTSTDREVLNYLDREQDNEIRAVLSPADYEEYQRRFSPSASAVQRQLQHFDATAAEYASLLELYEDSPLAESVPSSPLAMSDSGNRARSQAWKELLARFAATLPPDRAADLTDALDRNFLQYNRFVQEFGLGSDTTRGLLRLDRSFRSQELQVRSDPHLTVEQRNTALTALLTQADQQLAALLPPDALAALPSSSLGRHLTFIRQRLAQPRP
ncbi:hypothetical protein [Actomonas aquatica]|uniref:Lipase modulator n=1 Tax=Actomonas aquatica TaxID=2866162 RepID=A0ABZ1C965_9BACT|nr:hypothetical protein [Opitutus sp. WL0086]WRQ88241.1 hypothetical protein K1X11_002405 [Opitutus sp. WL0086]